MVRPSERRPLKVLQTGTSGRGGPSSPIVLLLASLPLILLGADLSGIPPRVLRLLQDLRKGTLPWL